MTSGDLIVVAPWLVFGAGLAATGYRLLRHRRTSSQPPGETSPPVHDTGAPDAPPAGGCQRSGTQAGSRKHAR